MYGELSAWPLGLERAAGRGLAFGPAVWEGTGMGRVLGRSGIEVSEVGFGCWAIGGPAIADGMPDGWGDVDDEESVAALRRGLELGVTFFDTADVYGAGHSEEVLGRALAGHRDEVVIATKFGYTFDAGRRVIAGEDTSPGYIRRACRASLRRLGTDRIDLYQLHVGDLPADRALEVAGTLDGLAADGLIRGYGWSTSDPQRAAAFASGSHGTAIQHELNVLADAPAMLAACDAFDLASINRGPLAMGLLTGKLTRLDAIREVLASGGRTLAQGALCWLLARSPRAVPIPGIKTVSQAEQNAAALHLGPLSAAEMTEITRLLGT